MTPPAPPPPQATPSHTPRSRLRLPPRRATVRRMRVTTPDGLSLHLERAGAGPPLLFIGGSGADLRTRPNVFDGPLARRFDLVSYDQRGLGRSDKPDRAYRMADYAADALAVLDHLGWETARVAGASFGGMVAQELAVTHPERVARLALICTSPGGAGGASYPLHTLDALAPEAAARMMVPISDTRHDDGWAAANPDAHAALLHQRLHDPFAEEPGRAMGMRRQLEARAGHDVFDRLHRIRCPTLVAAGRYDGIARPEAQQAMAAAIPGAELRWFEGGHWFVVQDRTAMPAIADWLAEAA